MATSSVHFFEKYHVLSVNRVVLGLPWYAEHFS